MKRTLFGFIFMVSMILILAVYCHAASDIPFAWDASNGATSYNVYQSTVNPPTKTSTKVCSNVTALTCIANGIPDGLFYYAATAKDAAGNESEMSNVISFNGDTTPPISPLNFRFSATITGTITLVPSP